MCLWVTYKKFFASLKSLKKGVGFEVGSGFESEVGSGFESAPKCHGPQHRITQHLQPVAAGATLDV
jgi:hypothetical protein